jgi:acetolactate synthase small subunit
MPSAPDNITSMPVTTFERELKSFKARLTQSEQSNFTDTTIEELHLTVASIQKTQISERMNKNITRLRTFLEAIESLSKILDLFVNISDFVAFVWGPIKYLLLVSAP